MKAQPYPELWCVDLSAGAAALQAVEQRLPRLSEADRSRAATFSDAAARDEWLCAQIALRLVLEHAVGATWRGLAFTRESRGKPQLAGAPVAFSLSHAPGLALIGITRNDSVGVDVERARKVRIAAARRTRICDAGAAMASAALPDCGDGGFLQAWVRLEALAKADGCGIGRLLTRLGIFGEAARIPLDASAMRGRAEALLADGPARCVRDLQLGEGIFAAVACVEAPAVLPVAWLPTDVKDLEAWVG